MSTLLFGAKDQGSIYSQSQSNLHDAGTPVTLQALTATWAPVGWTGDGLFRTVAVMVSANVGASVRVTPILNGVVLDGVSGEDCRIDFTLAAPVAGQRVEMRSILGLSRSVSVGLADPVKVGLRGTWLQFLVETIGLLDVSNGETNPDFRAEATEIDVYPLNQTEQVVNHG